MSDQLPRLGGLSEPEKYERLVDRVPGLWWSDAGPFAEDLDGGGLEGTFDLVFAVDVLEHIDDPERTIAGIARVLAPGGGLGFLTHNRTIAGFLQVVWDEEYVQHIMPEGFHDFARFITSAELSDALARHDMVVQEMKGVERAGDGTGRRVLTDDLSVTYLGWALRTR